MTQSVIQPTFQLGAIRAQVPQNLVRFDPKDLKWLLEDYTELNTQLPKKPLEASFRLLYAHGHVGDLKSPLADELNVDIVALDHCEYRDTVTEMHGFLHESTVDAHKKAFFKDTLSINSHICKYTADFLDLRALTILTNLQIEKKECVENKQWALSFAVVKALDQKSSLIVLQTDLVPLDILVPEIEKFIASTKISLKSIIVGSFQGVEAAMRNRPISLVDVFPYEKAPGFPAKSIMYDRRQAGDDAHVPIQAGIYTGTIKDSKKQIHPYPMIIADFAPKSQFPLKKEEIKKSEPIVETLHSSASNWPYIGAIVVLLLLIFGLAIALVRKGSNSDEDLSDDDEENLENPKKH